MFNVENEPTVRVFSSQKKMDKFVKAEITKEEFKEFQECGTVDIEEEDMRYFYFDTKVE